MEQPGQRRPFWPDRRNGIRLVASFVTVIGAWIVSEWLEGLGLRWWAVLPLVILTGCLIGTVAHRVIVRKP